jgi:glycosyltransferase involved in cell wall biosynthesis
MAEPTIPEFKGIFGLSFVLPAHNEEDGIGPTIEAAIEGARAAGIVYEIIVVDDGSTDGTAERARCHGIRLLQHSSRMGYGASVVDGIQEARHEWVAICDADGTYPAQRVVDLLRQASADVPHVMGQRNIREPALRSFSRTLFFSLARFVAGAWIPDVNSGFQLIRRDLALEHAPLLPRGFSCTTTLPLLTILSGRRIVHVPVAFGSRYGTAKLRVVRDGLGAVRTVLRIFWLRRPGKFILSVAVLLLILGMGGYGVARLLK